MKRPGFEKLMVGGMLACFFLSPLAALRADDDPATSEKTGEPTSKLEAVTPKPEPMVSKTELDKLKTEWEAVREQQVQMIREKEDQLEKIKEEIFSKMKALNTPAVTSGSPAGETSKTALQAERQKFFVEMSRQKESLRQLQASLDEKTRQLAAERERFEQEKKTAGR